MRAERRELQRAAEWIADLGRQARLPPSLAFRLELCAGEALANIVEHAFEAGRPGEIALLCEQDDESLTLVVDDDGRPFDPLALPPRLLPRRLEDAEPGGLGVPLIRKFAQICRYERLAGRNRLTMSWRRSDAPGDPREAG